ncbi:MAG: hypothetical protein FH751_16570 [Firmicutes bacterium]|nr:hypothetical protein [Bacillota bacterium]
MKKRYLLSLIIILIISNIITMLCYFNYKLKYEEELKYNIESIYFLEGENSNWSFKEGILILGKYKQYFSGKSLNYIGNKSLDTNYLEIKIDIKQIETNKNKESLLHVIHNNKSNKNIMRNNKIHLGKTRKTTEQIIKYNYDLNLDAYVCVEIKYNNKGKVITDNLKLQAKAIDLSNFKTNNKILLH